MIIVLKANTPKEEAKKLVDAIKAKGLQVDISKEIGRASCRERV